MSDTVLFGNEFEEKRDRDPKEVIAATFAGCTGYDFRTRQATGCLTTEDILRDLDGAEIVCAHYEYEDYQGTAFVLYVKDGAPYEVNGGHCSCSGLEGQWEPEQTTWDALKMRKWDDWGEPGRRILDAINRYSTLAPA